VENPLADGAKFCTKCGATQPAAQAPAVGAPAVPAAKGSSTGMKILIGVLAFFMFLIMAVAGSCVYIGYRVKQKAQESRSPWAGMQNPTPASGSLRTSLTQGSCRRLGPTGERRASPVVTHCAGCRLPV